jgi:predicted ATP-grasp superfamily ATP-dependent carboligase/thioredoxin reductase
VSIRGAGRRGTSLDVLVLDAEQRQSLVCVRSLGVAGMSVGAFASERAPAFSSRWCKVAGLVPDVAVASDAFVDAVVERAIRHGATVAICAHDGSVEALRRRRSEIEEHVALALADERALTVAVSKERTLALADELGIPTPRGASVDDVTDVDTVAEELGFPLVVKPSVSWAESSGARLVGALAVDLDEARVRVEEMTRAGTTALVQEWLTGSREAVSLFRADGEIKARFAQVAHRMYPPLGGSSVARESIPLPADVGRAAEELVEAIGLDGYCEVEFRRDASGEAKLMEINPRLSASVEIAVRAGVDFPLLLARWAAGDEIARVTTYQAGIRMRWLGGDLRLLRHALGNGHRPESAAPWPALATFVADFFRRAHYDYVARNDARPAVAATAVWLGGRTHRRKRHFAKLVHAPRPGGMMTQNRELDLLIVGAGPYGLSLAAHARETGLSYRIVGRPMDSWIRQMPVGMVLKSEGFASNISDPRRTHTLKRFCERFGREYGDWGLPVRLETFVDYGLWFQRELVPEVEPVTVEAVEQDDGGFHVEFDNGSDVRSRRVAIACGHVAFRHLPAELQRLPGGLVSHAADHRDFSSFAGKEVVVLGAGQSALETAALLHEGGASARVVARKAEVVWNGLPEPERRPLARRLRVPVAGLGPGWEAWFYSTLPRAFTFLPQETRIRLVREKFGPAGAWWLRDRVEGRVPILTGRVLRHAAAENGGIRLTFSADGREEDLAADHVVAATGYRVDLRRLSFLGSDLLARLRTIGAAPALTPSYESSVPGLHFAGLAAAHTFGPAMRFVYGTRFASSALVGGVAKATSRWTLAAAGGEGGASRSPEVDQAAEMVRQR